MFRLLNIRIEKEIVIRSDGKKKGGAIQEMAHTVKAAHPQALSGEDFQLWFQVSE